MAQVARLLAGILKMALLTSLVPSILEQHSLTTAIPLVVPRHPSAADIALISLCHALTLVHYLAKISRSVRLCITDAEFALMVRMRG